MRADRLERATRLIRGYGREDAAGAFETVTPNMRNPDMILPIENGWLAEVTGGEDKTTQLRDALAEYERTGRLPGDEQIQHGGE